MIIKTLRKVFYKTIGSNPLIDRWVRYRDPRKYWERRGGEGYFSEQEAAYDRTFRSQFIAEAVGKLKFGSLLEIGCGYGKQLKNFCSTGGFVVGCDFSRPQLLKAKEFCSDAEFFLIEADAEHLPFRDKMFDVVLSSAVILHNPYEKAQRIISEMIRVSRKYLVHNEDTDITFSRYGYDMRKTYERMNFRIVETTQIPCAPDPSITQFTIIELAPNTSHIAPSQVMLEHH